jgi:hypothetical protein
VLVGEAGGWLRDGVGCGAREAAGAAAAAAVVVVKAAAGH